MSNKFMYGSSILLGDNTVPGVQLSPELKKYIPIILQACRDYGLDFYPTIVNVLTYDEISEIAAYGGFPVRFPHWSFGAEYEELQRGYEIGSHKIFEMVVNTNPCHIYNLSSNTLVDHLTVVAHATGHNDFFKNNIYFSATDTNMVNKMANHGTRIRKYMARWGKERVTEFLDYVMRLETLVDGAEAWSEKVIREPNVQDHRTYRYPRLKHVEKERLYMEPFLNTRQIRQRENERVHREDVAEEIGIFTEPTKNILAWLRDNAPLKPWQADIVAMLYEEAIYFYPQRQTKVLNEGFACGLYDCIVPTSEGLLCLGDIVENKKEVFVYDGEKKQKIVNWFKFENRNTIEIMTQKGFKWGGSENHRILNSSKEWQRLDEFEIDDKVFLSTSNIWTEEQVEITWQNQNDLVFLKARQRKLNGKIHNVKAHYLPNTKKQIKVPTHVNADFASFLGYLIGDGHISVTGRTLGLTSGDMESISHFEALLTNLFDVKSKTKWDGSSKNGRYRISASSTNLEQLLVHLGLKTGKCARIKEIPSCIMKSPKDVVAAFIRSYFDCDAYAGKEGIILSTSSEKLGEQIQNLLLNFGIICTRKQIKSNDPKKTHIWHVSIRGKSAKLYAEQIGFNLKRKTEKLSSYLQSHVFYKSEKFIDKIVSIKRGKANVYDITVENTHKYSAQGFINHNSTVDSEIMAQQGFVALGQESHDCGIVEYAAHKMSVLGGKYSTNPYKLGYYLLKDIKDRWDKGKFGDEYDNCTNMKEKENWDRQTNLGKEKIFEVRKYYNDFTLINEFFTEEFCRKQEYFHWKHYPNGEFKIENRDYKEIKNLLMRRHLNGGLPDIRLTETNYRNTGALFLQHYHDGRDIFDPYVKDVLCAIRAIWNADVYLSTKNKNGVEKIYWANGSNSKLDVEVTNRERHLKPWK